MALVLVLILLVVVTSFVLAWGAFRSGATWDVVGDRLTLETLGLAESAADETALRLGRLGNTPDSKIYQALRHPNMLKGAVTPGEWDLGDPARLELVGSPLKGFDQLVEKIRDGAELPRFELGGRDVDLIVHDRVGSPHLIDLRGEIRYTAEVRGIEAKRSVTRTISRRQGFRLSRLALPYPFDSMTFFSRDAHVAMDRAPSVDQGKKILESLDHLHTILGPLLDGVAGMEGLANRLATLRDIFRPGAHAIYDEAGGVRKAHAACSLYPKKNEDRIADLRAWQLGEITTTVFRDLKEVYDPIITELRYLKETQDAGRAKALEDAVSRYLDRVEGFRAVVQPYFESRVFLGHSTSQHKKAFGPALDTFARLDEWMARAWYRMADIDHMARIFPQPEEHGRPIARNGVVHLTPGAGKVARLDTARVWGAQAGAPGRLVLLVDGDAEVDELLTHERGLVTIVTRGKLEVSGRVQACLVSLGGMTFAAGTRIRGNVIHLGGALTAGPGVEIERDARIHSGGPLADLDGTLYHLALDPSLETELIR